MLKIFAAYANFVLARPKTCLAIALLLFLSCVFLGKDVRLNNQFAALFSIDNEANQYRQFFREAFGANDAVLLALIKPKQVDEQLVLAVEQASEQLAQNPHFIDIYSPSKTAVIWANEEETVYIDPVMHGQSELEPQRMMSLMQQSPFTAGQLVALNNSTFAIVAQMPNEYDSYQLVKRPAIEFQQVIEQHFAGLDAEIHYAGMAFTRIAILNFMMRDLFMLVPLTTLVVMGIMYTLFRRKIVVVISLACSVFSVAATLALMGATGEDISQLSLTFPILLMVIVVANTVHFFHRFFSEREAGLALNDAVFITTQRIGIAALLSCFTTMIGFYTLMTANMPALFSYGFYVGTGVMLSFFCIMLIIPPCLLLFAPEPPIKKTKVRVSLIDRMVAWVIDPKHCYKVCIAGFVLLAGSGLMAYQVKYDYFLRDMLQQNHPQTIANRLMDKEFSGSLPLEISLLGKAGDFKNPQVLARIPLLATWLEQQTGTAHWLSIASMLASLNQAIGDDKAIPNDTAAIEQLLLIAQSGESDILRQLVNEDFSHARMKATINDIGAARLMQVRQQFEAYANQQFEAFGVQVSMTGELPVYYEGMNQITTELIQSVLFALVLVVLTIWAVFRDANLAIASIFPNILPIILSLACYAIVGEAVNPLPAIALCIGIGIAVDDTIHLFARFNEEVEKGKNTHQAVIDTVYEVKTALVSTSVILTTGFAIFLLSAFKWNQELGILGALLIMIALLADLILTPAILSLQKPRKS